MGDSYVDEFSANNTVQLQIGVNISTEIQPAYLWKTQYKDFRRDSLG